MANLIFLSKTQCGLSDVAFNGIGMWVVDVAKLAWPEKSNSAMRREIKSGAFRIDDKQITDDKARVAFDKDSATWIVVNSD